jgi:hypothetical protein
MKNVDSIVLLMSDSHGIYIPQFFIDDCSFWEGISTDCRDCLAMGPDYQENPSYWEYWDECLNSAYFIDKHGNKFVLWQDGDLWAYCPDIMTDLEYSEFFGECRHCGDCDCKGECLADYSVCFDCMQAIINDEFSVLDYYLNEPEASQKMREIKAGIMTMNNPVYMDIKQEHELTDCDCCNSKLHGNRFLFRSL